jgi:hypothetical protein
MSITQVKKKEGIMGSSQQHRVMHIKQTHITTAQPNLLKEHASPTHGWTVGIKHENTTMCIIHKGFRGFRALSSASNLAGNLIGLKSASLTKSYTSRWL